MTPTKSETLAAVLPTLICSWCQIVIREGLPKRSHGICRRCRVRHFPATLEPLAA